MDVRFLFVFFIGGIIHSRIGVDASEEHKLIAKLLGKYQNSNAQLARPVNSSSDKLNLKFGVVLNKADVNTETKRLTASVWFKYTWTDKFLRWTPAGNGDLSGVRIAIQKLWTPDIFLFNSFGHMDVNTDALAIVYSSGSVLWIPPATINVDCTLDGDVYSCPMKFGSWTYNGNLIDLDFYEGKKELDVTNYFESNTFELVGTAGNRTTKFYECCSDEPYQSITYHLKLQGGTTSGSPASARLLPITLLLPALLHYLTG